MLADWLPGDDPTTHPLWPRQVALEQKMLREGADRFRASVNKAREKGNMSSLKPHRRLIDQWLPALVQGIEDFIRDARSYSKRMGLTPIALSYLTDIDPYLAAFITLQTVIDQIAARRPVDLISLETRIGTYLEHEAKMREWEGRDPKLYYAVRRQLKRQHATAEHRRRVNINRFNKLLAEKLEWRAWPLYERRQLGECLIDILVRHTGQFTVGPDPFSTVRAPKVPKAVMIPSAEVVAWLIKSTDRAELLSPVYKPTLIPPKRWKSTREGAYYTEYVPSPPLIRFKAHQEDQQRGAADEYDGLDMPKVYTALNVIQEVGWRINRKVLEVAEEAWRRDLGIGELPVQEPELLPPKARPGATDEEILVAKRGRAEARARNARNVSGVMATERTLQVAQQFRDDTFYFPHRIDFRGRMYPIPVDLQPQGRDFARGLLEFAEGKPVGDEGGWVAIQLANEWGRHQGVAVDKLPTDERVDWAYANADLFRQIAADPLQHREWAECDNPWQALAAVFDFVGMLDEGSAYVSHMPIRIDCTCSGLQHLSAATRDLVGGRAVNLVPGDRPSDIYLDVADGITDRLVEISMTESGEEAEYARWWLDLCGGKLPRGLTKRPVMILPYGGTQDAFFRYIQAWLKEEHPGAWKNTDKKTLGQLCAFMKAKCWDAVGGTVTGAMELMRWIKECARKAAQENQPLFWTTPSGFVVRHFYGKVKEKRVRTRINGQSYLIRRHENTTTLDTEAQLRGISPNFIHSLDAAANTIALCKCQDRGVTSVTSIHDAFGSLAADMPDIGDIVREAFVEVHREDVLGAFREACQVVLAGHVEYRERANKQAAWDRAGKLLPEPMEAGELDLDGVLGSNYFCS